MIELLWYLIIITVILLLLYVLARNVRDDFRQTQQNPEEYTSIKLFKHSNKNKKSEILFIDFNRYLSLISIFTALAICLIILNSYSDLLLYLLGLVNRDSTPLGAVIISFFVAGFYYTKAIITQYNKTKMGTVEARVRSRAIVSGFLSFALFALILNFLPQLQNEYSILKTVNLSFVAGMGIFIVYQKMPVVPLLLSFLKRKSNSEDIN